MHWQISSRKYPILPISNKHDTYKSLTASIDGQAFFNLLGCDLLLLSVARSQEIPHPLLPRFSSGV